MVFLSCDAVMHVLLAGRRDAGMGVRGGHPGVVARWGHPPHADSTPPQTSRRDTAALTCAGFWRRWVRGGWVVGGGWGGVRGEDTSLVLSAIEENVDGTIAILFMH